MPSQTTLIIGSMAPGARNGQDHRPTPPPSAIHCHQGRAATLTSCSPPWLKIGVTYLRPGVPRPRNARARAVVPWLSIVSIAAIMAGVAMGAAHLMRAATDVEVVDSALSAHAAELAWHVSVDLKASAATLPAATATAAPQPPRHAPLVMPSRLPPLPSVIPFPSLP